MPGTVEVGKFRKNCIERSRVEDLNQDLSTAGRVLKLPNSLKLLLCNIENDMVGLDFDFSREIDFFPGNYFFT